MKKRTFATAAAAAMALSLTAGPAFAAPPGGAPAGGDGACVAAGVQILKGAIGPTAAAADPGTIAAVILAHTNGESPVSEAAC